MKTLLFLLVLAGLVCAAGYYFLPQHMPAVFRPERRACQRMAEQCNITDPAQRERCADLFTEFRKTGGNDSVQRPIACMMESRSCMESAGCLTGAAGNQMLELMKGVGKSFGSGVMDSFGK